MGAHLVSLALARWTHVSDRAFRLLVRMALTALDEASPNSPAGLYFGGQDLLAMTLRNERGGKPESVLRTVRYAVDELIDAGAIERTKHGRSGQNAVFRLTLENARRIDAGDSPDDRQEEPSVPPQPESRVPPVEEPSVPDRGNPQTLPRNHEEPVEELLEEEAAKLRTDLEVVGIALAAKDPIFTDEEKPRLRLVKPGRGFGFCLPCHAEGKTTLAADPVDGAECEYHLRQEAS